MLMHKLHDKIQLKKETFYFDYLENNTRFYKNERDDVLIINSNKHEKIIYDKEGNIKLIIDSNNTRTYSEKVYSNNELHYENIYSKKSNKLLRLNKYNLYGNICRTYEFKNKLENIIIYKDFKIYELRNKNNKFIKNKSKNIELLKEGYVYVVSNKLFKEYKIGMTKYNPNKRIKGLNTSVPIDYKLEYFMYFNNRIKAEREIQSKLNNIKREFYNNSLNEIKRVFSEIKWKLESKYYFDS